MTEENNASEFDVNEVQAALTASRVLVAILETLGSVTVPTKTVFEATNKGKELLVDYDENGPSFIFRLPKEEEMTGEEIEDRDPDAIE